MVVSQEFSLLDDSIRQMGQKPMGGKVSIVKRDCRLRWAMTDRGCWVECIRYMDAEHSGWIREVLYSSKQAGSEYKKVFELYLRVAEGSVHTIDLVRRHNRFPVGQKVRLA